MKKILRPSMKLITRTKKPKKTKMQVIETVPQILMTMRIILMIRDGAIISHKMLNTRTITKSLTTCRCSQLRNFWWKKRNSSWNEILGTIQRSKATRQWDTPPKTYTEAASTTVPFSANLSSAGQQLPRWEIRSRFGSRRRWKIWADKLTSPVTVSKRKLLQRQKRKSLDQLQTRKAVETNRSKKSAPMMHLMMMDKKIKSSCSLRPDLRLFRLRIVWTIGKITKRHPTAHCQ